MRNKITYFILLALTCLIAPLATARVAAQAQPIDLALALKYFQEAEAICKQDNGRLWGRSLCGPMIFFEPGTRAVVANRADALGRLTKEGGVFVGRLPDEENAANTATNWAGVRWSMIFWWNLSNDDREERARLMVHESFHRIQEELGLPMSNPSNNHLDTPEGRVWLQLEWRALSRALTLNGKGRRNAIEDALVFRLHRRSLFPRAADEERGLEMNEGVAEYTGVRLSGRADTYGFMAARLLKTGGRPSFVRSFAYESGPAYGLLLDKAYEGWRSRLKQGDDFGALLQKAMSLRLPGDLKKEAVRRSESYGGAELRAAEARREADRLERVAKYRGKLVDSPVLILPLTKEVNYSFNPNNLVPLDDLGTIYPTARITDAWGILEVKGGALMMREKNVPVRLHVPAPAYAHTLQGEGWTLQLNEGWGLDPGERSGDYVLKKKKF